MRHFEIIGHALEAWFEIDFPPPFTGSVRLALVFTGKAVPCADFFFFLMLVKINCVIFLKFSPPPQNDMSPNRLAASHRSLITGVTGSRQEGPKGHKVMLAGSLTA